MTRAELILEREDLIEQLAAVNLQILNILKSKNKKYHYSNQEATHQVETQSLSELNDSKKYIKEQIVNIDSQLGKGYFVQIKNC